GDPDQNLEIGTITPRHTIDLRDNALAPTSGFFATSWFDLAQPYLGSLSTIGYYRFQLRSDYYIPITRDIIWFLSFRTGYEQSSAKTALPLIKEFTLGGIG